MWKVVWKSKVKLKNKSTICVKLLESKKQLMKIVEKEEFIYQAIDIFYEVFKILAKVSSSGKLCTIFVQAKSAYVFIFLRNSSDWSMDTDRVNNYLMNNSEFLKLISSKSIEYQRFLHCDSMLPEATN